MPVGVYVSINKELDEFNVILNLRNFSLHKMVFKYLACCFLPIFSLIFLLWAENDSESINVTVSRNSLLRALEDHPETNVWKVYHLLTIYIFLAVFWNSNDVRQITKRHDGLGAFSYWRLYLYMLSGPMVSLISIKIYKFSSN